MSKRTVIGAALERLGITPGNTYLLIENENVYTLFLHRHAICQYNDKRDFLTLNPCGYYTATTKKRMNQFLKAIGDNGRVYQRDGRWFYTFYSIIDGVRRHTEMNMNGATFVDNKVERVTHE